MGYSLLGGGATYANGLDFDRQVRLRQSVTGCFKTFETDLDRLTCVGQRFVLRGAPRVAAGNGRHGCQPLALGVS